MSEEEKILEEEQFSATGTIRDKLPELEGQNTALTARPLKRQRLNQLLSNRIR